MVGPALHFPLPSVGSLVEGSTMTGPTPQINFVDFDGERKNDVVMSLIPKVADPPSKSGGWLMSGAMRRTMRFQFSFIVNGMTGCTLSTNRVSSDGPTFCSQLN